MSNIFRGTAIHYFQIPQDVMTIWSQLKPASQHLYSKRGFLAVFYFGS